MKDILKESAIVWETLCDTEYHLVFGRKGNLHNVDICFSHEEFFHLAGLHYADDVPSVNSVSHKQVLLAIKNEKILLDDLMLSENYNSLIAPRLIALSQLENLLDNDFITYQYNQASLPFYTQIQADYINKGDLNDGQAFLFLSDSKKDGKFICRSIFEFDGNRDYTQRQTFFKLLKKEKLHHTTQRKEVFIDCLSVQQKPCSIDALDDNQERVADQERVSPLDKKKEIER